MDDLLAHSGWVRSLALSLARDPATADDLVQQAYLRVLEIPPAARSASPGWFATIVRNLARDGFRRESRRSSREAVAAREESLPSSDVLVARAEAQRRLIDAVVGLAEPQRSLVLLRYYEGLEPREIAKRTGTEPATVRTRLHRALAELRGRLGDDARLVVVPLCTWPDGGVSTVRGAAATKGGTAMSGAKMGIGAAAVGTAAVVWWFAQGGPAAAPAAPEEKPAETGRAAPVESPATPAPPPSAPAAAAAPKPDRRIPVQFLRYVEATKGPESEGETASASGGEASGDLSDAGGEVITERMEVGLGAAGMSFGGWSRFAPAPERGTVTYRVRVVDSRGRGVEGADVFRVRPDDTGRRASPCSYEWIETMGKTDAAGLLEAQAQPEGSFLIAADWHHRLSGNEGLDLSPAVAARGAECEVVGQGDPLLLRLPIDVAASCSVSGRVVDDEGRPLRNVGVGSGWQLSMTDADGRYSLSGFAPGATLLQAGALGFRGQERKLSLVEGETATLDWKLTWSNPGDLEIAGRVLDTAGQPVADMELFLEGSEMRTTRSGPDGHYRFAKLPATLGGKTVNVMSIALPEDGFLPASRKGVSVPTQDADVVAERTVSIDVHFRDAKTGAPIPQHRLEARRELTGAEPQELITTATWEDDGTIQLRLPVGRTVMKVETPSHRGIEVAVEIADLTPGREIVLEMQPE